MWPIFYDYDANFTHFINSFSKQNFISDQIVMIITSAGIPLMILAVAGQWWSRNNRSHTRYILLTAGFSFLLALTFNQFIIFFVQRVRPYDVGVTSLMGSPSIDSSFPSDHASAAFAIAFTFLFRSYPKQGFILAICASIIALSRVYVGTHYLSDVIGGMLTAFIATLSVCLAFRERSLLNHMLIRIL